MFLSRWIHIECDKPPDNDLDTQLKEYICSLCKHSEGEEVHSQPCEIMETAQLLPEVGTGKTYKIIELEGISRII